MGKNRTIKILGGIIGGMVAHKLLERNTNIKESLNHLRAEIDNYRDNLYYFSKNFHWNENDKCLIKIAAIRNLSKELKKPHFNDVKFNIEEAEELIKETINEII